MVLYIIITNMSNIYDWYVNMSKSLDLIGISRQRALTSLIARDYKNLNEFCIDANEDYAAIYRYIHKNVKIGDKVIARFSEFFKTTPDFFDKYIPNIKTIDIPIIDCLISNTTTLDEMIANSKSSSIIEEKVLNDFGWQPNNLFILIAKDTSMEPIIRDKAEVIVNSSQNQIENNKIYAVKINSNICLRKLIKSPISGKISLIPENVQIFPTEEIEPSNLFQVLGKVVYLKMAIL